MCFQKKKIIKLAMGVALVGLTLAVLCSSVFADIYTIPDTATHLICDDNGKVYLSSRPTSGFTGYNIPQGFAVQTNTQYYFTGSFHFTDGSVFTGGYTYYMDVYVQDSNRYHYLDSPTIYIGNNGNIDLTTKFISIRDLPDYYIQIDGGHPYIYHVIFRIPDNTYSDCQSFFPQVMIDNTSDTTLNVVMYIDSASCYRDINGNVYDALVMENLTEVSQKIDSVNNNLVSIDSSIDDMNTNVGNKLQQVQNKIDAAADQAHQDAQDQVDAIEDLPQQQYDYEHQQDQNAADEYIEEFSGGGGTWDQEIDSYIDIEGLQESIGNLYGAFINNQKSYTIIFPGSGNVPILNKTLWAQQSIDLQPFATSTPGRIMIIACNGVFSLVGIIGLVVFIRRVLQDILHH